MKFFGLRIKGEKFPLGCIADCDVDGGVTVYDLVKTVSADAPPWMVSRKEVAEKAAITNSGWYDAEYETPSNDYFELDIEVIEFTLNY